MPLFRKSCCLRGVDHEKFAFEFAAAKHLPHPSNKAKNLARLIGSKLVLTPKFYHFTPQKQPLRS
jgi:hypothetical protein